MLFRAALVILIVLAVPVAVGGLALSRTCSRRGLSRGLASVALVLNVFVLTTAVIAAGAALLTTFGPGSQVWSVLGAVIVYVLPLATIVSVVLDVLLLSSMLTASRAAPAQRDTDGAS